MRHFVNYALLLFFLVLAISGLLSFLVPFKLLTTRIHIVFGFGVLVLVILHVVDRLKYYGKSIQSREKRSLPSKYLVCSLILVVLLLFASAGNWWPVRQLINLGYEARNKAIIFRSDDHTAYKRINDKSVLKHLPGDSTEVRTEIEWGKEFDPDNTQIAIWAENTVGMMIKTFFVSEESAFSEEVQFGDTVKRRSEILPVWRHRFTLLSGVDPDGNLDGASGATPEHSFSIDQYLKASSQPFYLYVEINKLGDEQSSSIYGAYIEVKSPKEYYLLPLVAHGGDGDGPKGHMFYDLEKLTSAKDIVEKILVRVVRKWE